MKLRLLALSLSALLVPAALAAAASGKGDPRRGEIAYRKCHSCHALESGKALEGPSLHQIFGRRVAAQRRFNYSPAMRALAARQPRWDAALLDRFIADPEAVAPRTSMNFPGLRDRRERADLIAYLRRR